MKKSILILVVLAIVSTTFGQFDSYPPETNIKRAAQFLVTNQKRINSKIETDVIKFNYSKKSAELSKVYENVSATIIYKNGIVYELHYNPQTNDTIYYSETEINFTMQGIEPNGWSNDRDIHYFELKNYTATTIKTIGNLYFKNFSTAMPHYSFKINLKTKKIILTCVYDNGLIKNTDVYFHVFYSRASGKQEADNSRR